MKPEHLPIFITAASISLLAGRAVLADRFKNTTTDTCVLIGGILPWFTVGLVFRWLPTWPILVVPAAIGLWGTGLIFLWALLRYWLGPRFDGWQRAAIAMVAAILAAVGFNIATGAVFFPLGR